MEVENLIFFQCNLITLEMAICIYKHTKIIYTYLVNPTRFKAILNYDENNVCALHSSN